jgi:hypothetical protein
MSFALIDIKYRKRPEEGSYWSWSKLAWQPICMARLHSWQFTYWAAEKAESVATECAISNLTWDNYVCITITWCSACWSMHTCHMRCWTRQTLHICNHMMLGLSKSVNVLSHDARPVRMCTCAVTWCYGHQNVDMCCHMMLWPSERVHVLSHDARPVRMCTCAVTWCQACQNVYMCCHMMLWPSECVHVLSEQYKAQRIKVDFSVIMNWQEMKPVTTLQEFYITQWTEGFSIVCDALGLRFNT